MEEGTEDMVGRVYIGGDVEKEMKRRREGKERDRKRRWRVDLSKKDTKQRLKLDVQHIWDFFGII